MMQINIATCKIAFPQEDIECFDIMNNGLAIDFFYVYELLCKSIMYMNMFCRMLNINFNGYKILIKIMSCKQTNTIKMDFLKLKIPQTLGCKLTTSKHVTICLMHQFNHKISNWSTNIILCPF